MQKSVVRLRAMSPDDHGAAVHSLRSGEQQDQTRQYILDMIGQLALLANQEGDPVLSAMLREVLRRQGRRSTPAGRTHG